MYKQITRIIICSTVFVLLVSLLDVTSLGIWMCNMSMGSKEKRTHRDNIFSSSGYTVMPFFHDFGILHLVASAHVLFSR